METISNPNHQPDRHLLPTSYPHPRLASPSSSEYSIEKWNQVGTNPKSDGKVNPKFHSITFVNRPSVPSDQVKLVLPISPQELSKHFHLLIVCSMAVHQQPPNEWVFSRECWVTSRQEMGRSEGILGKIQTENGQQFRVLYLISWGQWTTNYISIHLNRCYRVEYIRLISSTSE